MPKKALMQLVRWYISNEQRHGRMLEDVTPHQWVDDLVRETIRTRRAAVELAEAMKPRPESTTIEIPVTSDLADFLGAMAHAYGWNSEEEAALRLLDAACAFDELTRAERLTVHLSP